MVYPELLQGEAGLGLPQDFEMVLGLPQGTAYPGLLLE